MKIKFFLFYFLINSVSCALEVVKFDPNIDNYAIKNVLSSVEREALPRVETLGEAFSLAKATLNSELEFWQDVKEQMLADNQRLNTIVGIIGSQPLNLMLRLQLFSYERRSTDTDEEYNEINRSREFDFYMFNAYKNVESLSRWIGKLQDVIGVAETGKFLKKKQTQTFQSVKYYVLTEFDKIIKQCEDQRLLFTTSTVKSINRLIQDYKNNNSSLDLDVAIRDISTILLPVFEEPQKKLTPSAGSVKKSKKYRKKHAQIIKSGKLNGNREQLVKASPLSPIVVVTNSPVGLEDVPVTVDPAAVIEVVPITVDSAVIEVALNPNLQIIDEKLQVNDLPKQDELLEETVLGDVDISYMSEAQAAALSDVQVAASSIYQTYQKAKVSKVKTLSEDKNRPQLSFEQKVIVKTLLGYGREYVLLSVPMAEFINVIVTLGGYVVRNKKNVHFIIPSWRGDGKWFSKAMHPLHKDDKGIIPRNTKYYWERARNLLLEANVEALL